MKTSGYEFVGRAHENTFIKMYCQYCKVKLQRTYYREKSTCFKCKKYRAKKRKNTR